MSSGNVSNDKWSPGQVWIKKPELEGLKERKTLRLEVKNTGDRPIQVGSHYHFFEVNKFLDFDRKLAYGKRLCIASGTAVRFEPGLSYEVELIEFGGERVCFGLNGLVNGKLDDEVVRQNAFDKAGVKGFKGV
jgi:urease subunit gamma/beta